jgi:hypothetical protein
MKEEGLTEYFSDASSTSVHVKRGLSLQFRFLDIDMEVNGMFPI